MRSANKTPVMSPPSPSLILLHRDVRTNLTGDSKEPKLVPLSSGGLQLFGFDGDEEVDSDLPALVLEAHLAVAPDLSFLALRGGSPFTFISTIDKNLIVMSSTFPGNRYRKVFVLFDTTDRSLRMIPAVPHSLRLNRTNRVLAVRHPGDERSYCLVIPGEEVTSISEKGLLEWKDVLFITPSSSTSPFSSTSPSSSISPSSSTSAPSSTLPWQMRKMANFPQLSEIFSADEVFSFRDHGYWADLSLGVMYCNCADVLADSLDPVDFHFISLPLTLPHRKGPLAREFIAELKAFRTIGCVGGYIKLVSIDGFITTLDAKKMKHRNVRVWRLENLKWVMEDRLSMHDLWHMPGFFKIQSLYPKYDSLAPMYPFLSTKEDHVIYFALGGFSQGKSVNSGGSFPTTVHFLLRVDMRLQDVSFVQIPVSGTPTMQNYFGVDRSILCPPVALARDGKGKGLALQAKTLAEDGKGKVLGLQAKTKGLTLGGDGKGKVPGLLQAKRKGQRI